MSTWKAGISHGKGERLEKGGKEKLFMSFRAEGLHPNESAVRLSFYQETGQGNILLLRKKAGSINNHLRAIIIFLNHRSYHVSGAGSSAKMRLMNSMGVLQDSAGPAAGWPSSTFIVLPLACLHGRISRTSEFCAMPWFRRLVEILRNLRPLLWRYLQGSFPVKSVTSSSTSQQAMWLIEALSTN